MADEWQSILLPAKVLGHLSRGLYRTPAGAIKELISNAFDADAGVVRIHTDFPRFNLFSCEDTGSGMDRREFDRLMNRGIGNSLKRTPDLSSQTAGGRPYIGRLGLGILALAQICSQFDVVSHHKKTKTAFSATIKFPPYTREELDKIAASGETYVHGGEFKISDITYKPGAPGVRIFTTYVNEQFRKRMRALEAYGNKRAKEAVPYPSFGAFLKVIYAEPPLAAIGALSTYEQLLFGLALTPPLLGLPQRNVALRLPSLEEREQQVKAFDFKVRVDNLLLAHPVSLPSDREGHRATDCSLGETIEQAFDVVDGATKQRCSVNHTAIPVASSDEVFNIYRFGYDHAVAGRELKFDGYLFQQTGRLYPRDIQGLLIRINNVAIGQYDASMMSFPLAEGPRYTMVSGEIYVDIGFEDALNIDRDSFNELHPHYIRLQAYVHGLLNRVIFPVTWQEEKGRNKARRDKKQRDADEQFVSALSSATGEKYQSVTPRGSIARVERKAPTKQALAAATAEAPVAFASRQHDIRVNRAHPLLRGILGRRKTASLMERVVIAYERSALEPTAARRRGLFYRLLAEIVKTL